MNNHGERERLRMFVLDVLRHDVVEQVSSIVNLLNDWNCIGWRDQWSHDFTREEVIETLETLVADELVGVVQLSDEGTALMDCETVPADLSADEFWFRMTKKGWQVWESWDPPTQPSS